MDMDPWVAQGLIMISGVATALMAIEANDGGESPVLLRLLRFVGRCLMVVVLILGAPLLWVLEYVDNRVEMKQWLAAEAAWNRKALAARAELQHAQLFTGYVEADEAKIHRGIYGDYQPVDLEAQ